MLEIIDDNENIRKIFGKKEIMIIKKQLNGIKLTQSEKNRLSRDIRPKFRAIKELSKFKDDFELKRSKKVKNLIQKSLNFILKDELNDKINAILLFGSHANNTATFNSDIDICIIFDDISLEKATKFRIRISGHLPRKVDVQVFNILPQKIKKEIAKNHKILYKKKI